MDDDTTFARYPEIDDRFWCEWIEFGMIQLNVYLATYARFAHYCGERDAPAFRRLESALLGAAGRDPLE
jgi:hypothetical protein